MKTGTNRHTRIGRMVVTGLLIIAGAMTTAPPAHAAGLLKRLDGAADSVRIRSHKVNVTINNGFARTEVDQVFANAADNDIEAIYTFPVPKQASLSEVSLWVNGQEIIGEVIEKKRARKIYEDQVQKGNDTALAEKNDFKTFDVAVGRVRAQSDTRVRLVYYQPLEIDLNVGRYVYPLEEGGVDDERIAFWSVDDAVTGTFSFNLKLKSAFPVKDVRLPGHDQEALISRRTNDAERAGGEIYSVELSSGGEGGGANLSRDIVFYYRLDDSVPARVELVPYREGKDDDGTVMVVVTPAADLRRIAEGTDWIFVLDVSGSMGGNKIGTLAEGVSQVLGKMSPNDRFQLITFNNNARNLTGGMVTATPENVRQWIERVKAIQANGGTALFSGLKAAYDALDDDRTTGIILVTDGVCNVGPTQHSAFLRLLNTYDIRLFTFVIGNNANQPLMDRLATDSGGFAMNISSSDDIIGRLIQAKAKVLHECMHDVSFRFRGEKVHDVTPAKVGNLYMGQQLVLFGRYSGTGEVDLEMTARISGEKKTWHCRAVLPETDTDNPELERLWALSTIDETMKVIREKGETEPLRDAVVQLGTEYSLVTDYTSMLVVQDDVLENEGIQRRNQQRVTRERKAQTQRATQPVKSYRVDQGQQTFQKRSSPGIGTGPVGPLFILLAWWTKRRKK